MYDKSRNLNAVFCPGTIAWRSCGNVFCVKAELQLAARKKINLENYKQKNSLFYMVKDVPIFVVSLALLVTDIVLLIIAIKNPVIRAYMIALIATVPVCGAVAWLSYSRGKCGRDLHVFDAYYVRVQDLLNGKARLEKDIDVCRRRVEELRGKLTDTVSAFNKHLSRKMMPESVGQLFAPVDTMLSSYLSDIAKFSDEIEASFNLALREFLHDNKEPELNILPLRNFDEVAVDDLLVSIKTSFGTGIASVVVDEVANGLVQSASSLASIMDLLHGLDVRVEGDMLTRFISAAAGFSDRGVLAKLLYKNKQIPATLLRETLIPNNFDWVFVKGMNKAYNKRDLTAILIDLLEGDRLSLCRKLLAGMDASDISVIDDAVEAERERSDGEENDSCRFVMAYRMIFTNTYAVGNSANIHENLALMLYDRRTELGFNESEQALISDIVKNGKFRAAGREIGELYQQAVATVTPLAESTTRILLHFLGSPAGNSNMFRMDLLARLLSEYKFTVSYGDLFTMRTLLAALTLISEKNENVLQAIFTELTQVPIGLKIPDGKTEGDGVRAGRLLLAHLTKNDRVRLRSVVYRTETERCTLDRIVRA